MNVICKVLLEPGDELLSPVPCFVEYKIYTDNANGVAKFVRTKDDFSLDLAAMRDALTEKTKIVLINSPNNPTGKVYDEASIRGLAELLEDRSRTYGKEIYLVSDEPYRESSTASPCRASSQLIETASSPLRTQRAFRSRANA